MADNTILNTGTGGDTIRDKDRVGVKTQIVGLDLAPGGAETLMNGVMPVSDNSGSLTVDAPVATPVFVRLSDGTSAIATLPVSQATVPGTAADNAVGLPAVVYVVGGWDGTNVQALATNAAGLLQVSVTSAPTTAVTGPLTDAQLRATPVPVSGTVTASGPLTDAQLRATAVPVSGPLTDTQLRATPVPVSGTVTASGPLTDAQLRATAVPVSGTVTASGPLTDAQLRATVVPVSDTGNVAHDAVDSGNPVKTGARARTTDVTAVAADDRTDSIATVLGKQVYMPYCLPGNLTKGTANSTVTTDTSVIAAPGAGVTLYITSITITNAHATVGTKVQIKSGTTATGYPRVYAAAVGGGASMTFPSPLKLAANEALQFACVTTGADVDVSAVGYTAAE